MSSMTSYARLVAAPLYLCVTTENGVVGKVVMNLYVQQTLPFGHIINNRLTI